MFRPITIVLAVTLGGGAALADPVAECSRARNSEARLQACSEVIAGARYTDEQRAVAFRLRGKARTDAGAATEAIADYDAAIRLAPIESTSYAGRGRARVLTQDMDGAMADFTEAIRLGSTPSLYASRGHVRFVKGDLTGAIADFTEAIRLDPKSASTFNRRGLAHRRAGNLPFAVGDYTAAIALNPLYALAYNNRGYVYEALGRTEDAIADFQSALLLDSSLVGARDALRRLGFPDEWLQETQRRIDAGRAIVELNCSRCHAVARGADSPNRKAPPFYTLHARHPSLALREPLSRGIAAPHEEMPRFVLAGIEIDAIVAYINSLSGGSGQRNRVPGASGSEPADGEPAARRPR